MDKQGNLVTDLSAREIDEMFADGTIQAACYQRLLSPRCGETGVKHSPSSTVSRIPHSLLLEI